MGPRKDHTKRQLLNGIIPLLSQNIAEEIDLDTLASSVGMSRFCFCRTFHKLFGISPVRWLWRLRAHVACQVMSAFPERSLTDVAFACGFTSSAHFSRHFRRVMGTTPSKFRENCGNTDVTGTSTCWEWDVVKVDQIIRTSLKDGLYPAA